MFKSGMFMFEIFYCPECMSLTLIPIVGLTILQRFPNKQYPLYCIPCAVEMLTDVPLRWLARN